MSCFFLSEEMGWMCGAIRGGGGVYWSFVKFLAKPLNVCMFSPLPKLQLLGILHPFDLRQLAKNGIGFALVSEKTVVTKIALSV